MPLNNKTEKWRLLENKLSTHSTDRLISRRSIWHACFNNLISRATYVHTMHTARCSGHSSTHVQPAYTFMIIFQTTEPCNRRSIHYCRPIFSDVTSADL